MDSAQLDSPQPGNYDGLMQKSNIGSCKKIGSMRLIPKSTTKMNLTKIQQEDKSAVEQIWNKRMMDSKQYDRQTVVKYQQFDTLTLICLFLILFGLLFYLAPTQFHYPDGIPDNLK